MPDFLMLFVIAGAAALASPAGGLLALWLKPTTLFMSVALGFASGVLLATICFEMLPQALELGSLLLAIGGFTVGFLAVYAFDLFVYRGQLAGEGAAQRPQVERFYRQRRPRGSEVTVLAGGTSAEELIEGLSIGLCSKEIVALGACLFCRRCAKDSPACRARTALSLMRGTTLAPHLSL